MVIISLSTFSSVHRLTSTAQSPGFTFQSLNVNVKVKQHSHGFLFHRASIFPRFVDALLNDQFNIQWDIHNLPLYLKCDVCNIPYSVIGKQETEYEVTILIYLHVKISPY